jgi:hypothetical protein
MGRNTGRRCKSIFKDLLIFYRAWVSCEVFHFEDGANGQSGREFQMVGIGPKSFKDFEKASSTMM